MESDISDEELRSLLAVYMKTVPPVTDTTREVLVSKLEKFKAAEAQLEDIGDDVPIVSVSPLEFSPKFSPSKEPLNGSLVTNGSLLVGEANETNFLQPKDAGSLSASPSQESSSVWEYASRLPSYRRRSIHPERPNLGDPYSEFILSNSLLQPSPHYRRPAEKPPSNLNVTKSPRSINRTKKLVRCFVDALALIPGLLVTILRFMTYTVRSNKPSVRIIALLVVVSVLAILVTRLLIGDPFYHNPVSELGSHLQFYRS
ncbi:unnamed protein product [Calicophoron daubneyi]|uniref:LEM domain-containing protein n=1 Tax=Calicophoron daubneyi TaxID=300641 RepID=A0AAV2TWZ2_CALDB